MKQHNGEVPIRQGQKRKALIGTMVRALGGSAIGRQTWERSLSFQLDLIFFTFAAIIVAPLVANSEGNLAPVELGGAFPKTDPDGLISLFGGNDLGGWRGLPGYWFAKDGIIVGRQTKENSRQTFLVFTGFNVRDFELQIKYRFASAEGNSGIQFRSRILDLQSYRVGGYQADIDANGNFDGSIYDEAGVAGSWGTMSNRGEKTTWNSEDGRRAEKFGDSADLKKAIKSGDWNEAVLVARRAHITYSINGHVMTDLIDESPQALSDGVIALQLHEGIAMEVQFKDARIRILGEGLRK